MSLARPRSLSTELKNTVWSDETHAHANEQLSKRAPCGSHAAVVVPDPDLDKLPYVLVVKLEDVHLVRLKVIPEHRMDPTPCITGWTPRRASSDRNAEHAKGCPHPTYLPGLSSAILPVSPSSPKS